uniref:Uncharacterized protein n=1 Tax=Chlamydomonas euryale TaxID=1486919 RepID=A0A7R9V9N9_9CHLO|mmetsp:Transcript_24471/g.72547  ORF Transcript_24471/g.72547 Transcript_24471/m.72547 type:complete len:212 (+) Transcript_24471:133-768(+)
MFKIFQKQPDPKELVRKWQQDLRKESRTLDRQIRDIQFEEKKVQNAIKEAAKRGDIGSAKSLAKEIIQSRKAVSRLHTNKAQMMSIGTALREQLAMIKVAGTIGKSNEVMKEVSALMRVPELQQSMMEMSKEMTKAGLIEEMMGDMMDSALDTEDMEDDTDAEVAKVLAEIAGETAALLPTAQQAAEEATQAEEEPDEMAQLRARLDAVKA